MARDRDEVAWTLSSSNGFARIVCLRPPIDAPPRSPPGIRFEYQLPHDPQPGAIADLPAFPLTRSAAAGLIAAITDFLRTPTSEIEPRDFVYTAELAERDGDHLSLSFGPLDEVVTGSTGIGCLAEIARSAFSARMAFRTDLTCLERLAEDLDAEAFLAG